MITRTVRAVAGTMAVLGALVACSSPTPAPTVAPTPPAVAELVAAHPGCAGKVEQLTDGGVSCAVEGRLYLLYVLPTVAAADDAAASLRTLHPAGTVDVAGTRVWVTE